jgi:hypothetical protein
MKYKGISVEDMYRMPLESLPIPSGYRVVDFLPPRPKQLIFSVLNHTVEKCTAPFHELCPRLVVEEIEPCELCKEFEPVTMTEIKKSAKARTYSLMLLCAGCIQTNEKFIKR